MKKLLLTNGRRLLLCCLMAACSLAAWAQSPTVKGKVTDSQTNEGLPGVNVLIKGTTNGTTTDADGNYSITLSGGNIISFSFIGYKSVDVNAENQTTIDVKLQSDITSLEEVVVVGYGTQKKSDVTGAISSAKGEDLRKFATNSPADALQGQVAGVMIRRNSGSATAGVDITIRGMRGWGNNFPLVIIDGIQGNINNVNPEDIQSIEVLKDAAAASIYGSTAANGVILITTKKAKAGEIKIDFTAYAGADQISKKLQFMDKDQWLKMARAIAPTNASNPTPNFLAPNQSYANTNWFDETYKGDGAFQNYNIALSGATDHLTYLISGGMTNRNSVILTEGRERKNARLKLGVKQGIFSADANISYQITNDKYFQGNLFNVYEASPIVPLYDPTTTSGFGYRKANWSDLPDVVNPIGVNKYTKSTFRNDYITTNLQTSVEPMKGLKLTGRVGIEQYFDYSFYHQRPFRGQNKDSVRFHTVSETYAKTVTSVYEGFATYQKQVDRHNFDALIGAALQNYTYSTTYAAVEGRDNGTPPKPVGFIDPNFETLNAGNGGIYSASGYNIESNRISYFGRINYNYDNKYFAQVSIRRDASSRFGPAKRVGVFPSVALGWTITEESFFQVPMISSLKLRVSYGELGSESNLATYDWQVNTQNAGSYPFGTTEAQRAATTFRKLENVNLGWETSITTNVGLDFGLLKNRVTGSVNYYSRTTQDLIIDPNLPPSTGGDAPKSNLGDVKNTGFEIETNYKTNLGPVAFTVGATYSYNTNIVTRTNIPTFELLGDGTIPNRDNGPANRTRLNYPVGGFFLYQAEGIFKTNAELAGYPHQAAPAVDPANVAQVGDVKFKDVNKDGVLNNADLVYVGSGIPSNLYGLNLGAQYKGFDVSVTLYAATGFKIYNAVRQAYSTLSGYSNQLASASNFYTATNTATDIPRAVWSDPNRNTTRNSTRFLEDGDYLRVRNIQIGYTLPKELVKKVGLNQFRVYISGQNLFTVTSYTGVDPEVGGTRNAGTDFSRTPYVKTFLAGVQLSF